MIDIVDRRFFCLGWMEEGFIEKRNGGEMGKRNESILGAARAGGSSNVWGITGGSLKNGSRGWKRSKRQGGGTAKSTFGAAGEGNSQSSTEKA